MVFRIVFWLLAFWVSTYTISCLETAGSSANPDLPGLNGRKVLVLYGGWEGHQPDVYARRMTQWLKEEGAEVWVSDSLAICEDEALMATFDLILPYWTMGSINEKQAQGILWAVKQGAGIAGCHGGLADSFREHTEYQYMVGGQFVAHPGNEIDYRVNIINNDDPVSKGIPDFDIHTEQYYMHVDPNIKVLATTAFDGRHDPWINGTVIPVAWKKYFGQGRVFYLSIGHSPANFDVPEVWELLTRGVRWAGASKKLPQEAWKKPVYEKTAE